MRLALCLLPLPLVLTLSLLPCLPAAEAPREPGSPPADGEADHAYDYDGYPPYLDLVEAAHVPPAAGEKEAVRLRFDLRPHVPPGTAITFTLEYLGMEYDSTDYRMEGAAREGLTLLWRPKLALAPGEYYVRTRIDFDKQSPAVKAAIRKEARKLPLEKRPPHVPPVEGGEAEWGMCGGWPWLFMQDELAVTVGSEISDPAVYAELRKAYEDFTSELLANLKEFTEKLEAVEAGRELVGADGKLDVKGLESWIADWQKKQGALQERIVLLEASRPDLFLLSRTAYLRLRGLGAMVSKLSRRIQDRVTEKYGAEEIRPVAVRSFDPHYRYPVSPAGVEKEREIVLRIIGYLAPSASPSAGDAEGERAGETSAERVPPAELPDLPEDAARDDG